MNVISIYVLADTFFISVYSGADGLAVLNLILPVYGLIYAIGSMIRIGSATRYAINKAKGENTDHYFVQSVAWCILAAIPFMLIGIFIPDKALATAVCPTVTMAICTTHYRSHKNHVGFRWKKPSFSHLISCCQLGVSAFVGEMSSGVTAIVFNFLILGIAGNVGVLWSRSKPRHRSSSHLQRSRSRRPATDE